MSKHSTDRKRKDSPAQFTGMWVRPEKRLALYLRDGFRCLYCGADLHHAPMTWLTLDHIVTQVEEKNNGADNVFLACKGCNCSRRATPLEEFADRAALGRIRRHVRKPLGPYWVLAKALITGQVS